MIDNRPFIVRERSPYKESFDLGTLKNQRVFNEFIEQIAIATATAVSKRLPPSFAWIYVSFLQAISYLFPKSLARTCLAYERNSFEVARPVQARNQITPGRPTQERSLEQGERIK